MNKLSSSDFGTDCRIVSAKQGCYVRSSVHLFVRLICVSQLDYSNNLQTDSDRILWKCRSEEQTLA